MKKVKTVHAKVKSSDKPDGVIARSLSVKPEMAEADKEVVSDDQNNTFKKSGGCSDEVVLLFDNDIKLYVSENFLCYASPVFNAMFKHNFKEKKTGVVTLPGKCFEDFHELLLCLHPRRQKPINRENVLRIVSLMEEYQVERSVFKCKQVMKSWIVSDLRSVTENRVTRGLFAKDCLRVITKAIECGHDDVIDIAIDVLTRVGYGVFTGTDTSMSGGFSFSNVTKADIVQSDCKRMFDGLPENLKTRILLQRLENCDNGSIPSASTPTVVDTEKY